MRIKLPHIPYIANKMMLDIANSSFVEIKDQLEYMEIMGGDILKVAYMPRSYKDVVCVMNATLEMSNKLTKPIVTMAMGEIGKITRLCGELTGSAMTFACLGKSSAPGQISVEHMHELLEVIHHD